MKHRYISKYTGAGIGGSVGVSIVTDFNMFHKFKVVGWFYLGKEVMFELSISGGNPMAGLICPHRYYYHGGTSVVFGELFRVEASDCSLYLVSLAKSSYRVS
jgi:hypothetical protein